MANPFSQTTRSLASDGSSFGMMLWLLALLMFGAWLSWFLLVPVTVYAVSEIARVEVERAAHPIASMVAGKILFTHVQLGKQVQAGEVLVELDAGSERLKLAEEKARLQSIPPQLAALERQIADEERAVERIATASSSAISEARSRHREALSTAQFAKKQSERMAQLRTAGHIAELEVMRVMTDADKTRSAADALSFEIKRLSADALVKNNESRAAVEALHREAAALTGQLELSTATIQRLQQDIDKHLIRAPVSGKIAEAAPLDSGAFVAVGEVVGRIVPDGALKVVADFPPARALGRVQPRQLGRMRLDGFPWAQYGSIKVQVDRVASEVRDGAIRVEFVPDSQRDFDLLQHGLPGAVEVEIERVTPAVLALRAAGQVLTRPVRQQAQEPLLRAGM